MNPETPSDYNPEAPQDWAAAHDDPNAGAGVPPTGVPDPGAGAPGTAMADPGAPDFGAHTPAGAVPGADPYAHYGQDATPAAAGVAGAGEDWGAGGAATPGSATDAGAWDTFGDAGPVWGDAEPADGDLDVGYLTQQHPQATEIGATDTAAGAQFFGDDADPDDMWQATGGRPPIALDGGRGAGDRSLGTAIITGVVLAAVAVICFWVSSVLTLVLLCVLMVLAAGEFYGAMRQVGYQPATLVGLVTAVGLPAAVYWRGAQAYPLAIGLAAMAALCWYLFGVTSERPIPNVAITMFGIGYVAVLGSFGALLLTYEKGTGLLFGPVIATVAYDTGAWLVGRIFGRTALSKASPNKTVEGLIGGVIAAVVASALVIGVGGIDPWGENPGSVSHALVLGVVAAVAATLGDLAESMIKRDLGIKDMGKVLPGHGGVLDRFDGLLFVMPCAWGLAHLINVV